MSSNTKSNGIESTEWARAPPSGPAWQRFLKAIYNPEEKSFLGRTAKRWGIVFTFYLVFYAVLALLFALCMGGLLITLHETRPTYTMEKSLIGSNPGVAHRPHTEDGSVLRYDADNATHCDFYTSQIEEFLEPYARTGWLSTRPGCNATDDYGFPSQPCFYIKLNKIFDWTPQVYEEPTSDMPEDLKEHISNLDPAERQQIWVSCWEEDGNTTKITYPWGRGLVASSYPFVNVEGYLSPLVAVKLVPKANTQTTIRCRTWAKNIIYNKSQREPSGYTRFQLYTEVTSEGDEDIK